MSEFEVWSVLSSFMISSAIFTAAVFFMVWVAFRAANQTAAEGGSLVAKILVTLFAIGVIFNGLTIGGNLMLILNLQRYLCRWLARKTLMHCGLSRPMALADNLRSACFQTPLMWVGGLLLQQ